MSVGKLPVVLGLVILLVIGLYVLSVALGTGDGCAPSEQTKASLRARFRPPALGKDELRLTGCQLVGDRLQIKTSCTIRVNAGSGPRRLTLVALSPAHVTFDPLPPDARESVKLDDNLKTGKSTDFTVPKGGADAVITCLSCAVQLD